MAGAAVAADSRFRLEIRVADGAWQLELLSSCHGMRFGEALPVLPFWFAKGLRSFADWWYFATTGAHVGFESWLERELMLMDFDPAVLAVPPQPFWPRWREDCNAAGFSPAPSARLATGYQLISRSRRPAPGSSGLVTAGGYRHRFQPVARPVRRLAAVRAPVALAGPVPPRLDDRRLRRLHASALRARCAWRCSGSVRRALGEDGRPTAAGRARPLIPPVRPGSVACVSGWRGPDDADAGARARP